MNYRSSICQRRLRHVCCPLRGELRRPRSIVALCPYRLLDVIRSDYIRTARAKGLPRGRYHRMARNGMIPIIPNGYTAPGLLWFRNHRSYLRFRGSHIFQASFSMTTTQSWWPLISSLISGMLLATFRMHCRSTDHIRIGGCHDGKHKYDEVRTDDMTFADIVWGQFKKIMAYGEFWFWSSLLWQSLHWSLRETFIWQDDEEHSSHGFGHFLTITTTKMALISFSTFFWF